MSQGGLPFNVISPASGEGGLGMIAQIREGDKQRQFQARRDEAARLHDEEMQRRNMEAEETFRARERYWAQLANDHQEELLGINEETQDAITRGDDAAKEMLLSKRAQILKNKAEVEGKVNGLSVLKQAHDGWFSRDVTDENGASVGARFFRHLKDIGAAHFQRFQTLDGMLQRVLSQMNAPAPATPQETGGGFMGGLVDGLTNPLPNLTGKKEWKEGQTVGQTLAGAARDVAGNLTATLREKVGLHYQSVQRPKPSTPKEGKGGGVEPAGYPFPSNSPSGSPPPISGVGVPAVDGPPAPVVSQYDELANALALVATGESGTSGGLAPTLVTMLTMLEKAADGDMVAKQAAVQAYKQAVAQGADAHVLDKALWQTYETVRTQGQATKMLQAKTNAGPEGDGVKAVGTDESVAAIGGLSAGTVKLAKMLEQLGTPTEVEPETGKSKMLMDWGPNPDWDPINKQPIQKTRDDMVQMMTVLAGARDPDHLLELLTNNDPSDDPKELSFIGKLHDDARSMLISDLKDIQRELRLKRNEVGLGTESVQDLPSFQSKVRELDAQSQMDIPLEAGVLQAGEHAKARQTGMEKKKALREKARKKALELYKAQLADEALGD